MSAGRAEELVQSLRNQGHRITTARRAVIESLLATDSHLSAEEVAEWVRDRHPEVHQATIYRTLASLDDLGVIIHTHLGHGPARYRLADDDHHHLVCDACGAVIDVPLSQFRALRQTLRTRYGFDADLHHFALPGRCAGCSPAEHTDRVINPDA